MPASETTAATTTTKKKTATTSSHSSSKSSTHKRTRSKTKGKTSKTRGQKAIESERAQQIQEALIRQHYMEGEPSGKWDDATQAALRRYQAAQGWQSKSVPDSRALIKLGLGPNHDHLLNPETAMTTSPAADAKAPAKSGASNTPTQPLPPAATAVPHQK
ncbi:MAG TPA: peptidoglycan-binding domain-containing protein [Terriglobales bacterium]|nr:peptidoglycan-binding domain-containing protein [Terriglobales bacterium]